MKKGFPEEHLYKLRSQINWAKRGRKALIIWELRKTDTKTLSKVTALEKLKKSSVSEATWARVRMVRYSFLHLSLVRANCRLSNVIGTGEYQYRASKEDEAEWVRRSQIVQHFYATLRNSVFIWQAVESH